MKAPPQKKKGNTPRQPDGYRAPYLQAESAFELYSACGVPRYVPAEQPNWWHQPQLSRIFDDVSEHYKAAASIKIQGMTTQLTGTVRDPYKEDRSWKKKIPRLVSVVEATGDWFTTSSSTETIEDEADETTSGRLSSCFRTTGQGLRILLTQPRWRNGRGRANGVCLDAIRSLGLLIKATYTSPGELAGRLVFCTISPGKRQGRMKHRARIAKLRRFLKALAEEDYKGLLGVTWRMAFAEGAQIPHYHCLVFLPQSASLATCRALSDQLFTEIDKRWRSLHGYGISKHNGWHLLETGEDVRRVIDYVCKDEANDGFVGSWGQTTFMYGTLPQPPAEVVEITVKQAKAVMGTLLHAVRQRVHPWKVNVVIEDIHPRLVLMVMLFAGVPVSQALLDRYRVPW